LKTIYVIHRPLDAIRQDHLDCVDPDLDCGVKPRAIFRRRPSKNPISPILGIGGFAYPHSDPHKIVGANMLSNGLQTIVAGCGSSLFDLDSTGLQVELIMHDDDATNIFDSISPDQRCGGFSTQIHEGRRTCKNYAVSEMIDNSDSGAIGFGGV